MKKIRVVVVDDSPFSVTLLSDMLTECGFEVVGDANSLESTIEVIDKLRPDIVTMDMTMPDTDGFECTRAIHKIDSKINVIIVSSMMDEEIVRKAKKNHLSGYIQKPVDKEELSLIINRIMSDEELYKDLDKLYYSVFQESFKDAFNKFTKSIPEFSAEVSPTTEIVSKGISVVMGIIGKYSGRLLIDISHDTALKLSNHLLKREPKDSQEMLNVIGEISNIIAGNACSVINKKNKLFGFRVAPPTIFHGESLTISKPELESVKGAMAKTNFGEIYMSIGFQRRSGEWMSNI
ncbi:response regulator [Clostridium hydrogenum]|uniref:response regulator n=1 Tax=Clostridium hydrogenum TaxID=2855764 RepID=UPI001F2E756A|nr:response regulator [Clostridium hydrogenum]